MILAAVHDILMKVEMPYGMEVWAYGDEPDMYLQVRMMDDKGEWQKGRKFRLSIHMTKSEVVQTAFMAGLAFMEHEYREFFTYRDEAIFQPHWDVDDLVELRQRGSLDVRTTVPA